MSESADFQPIRNLIEGCWPGEWGTDPIGDQSNCTVYRATDIDDEGHLGLEAGAARVVLPAKLASKALRKGDLLLEASGGAPDRPVGRVALLATHPSKPSLTSNFFRFMRPKANVDATFLTFQLVALNRSSAIWRYQQQTTGLINLKVHDYLGHPIWTPRLSTQRRIAAILTTIDTAIGQTEALIGKYQHIKAGLMHDLFTRGVLPSGQLRPPREQAPELYQETAIGWIPREWEITGLAAKDRPGTSWIRTGPFGSSLKGEHWRIDGHPVITIGALGAGEFIDSELLFVGPKDAARLLDFQLKTGDVVFSRVADVGRSVVVREAQSGWIMSSNLMRIAVNDAQLRPDYLQMQLAGDSRVKAQIRASVNSGGRDVANSEVLNRLRFAVPELNEQDRIICVANQLALRTRAEMRRVTKLQTQKLGLMQDLLTGKVAVKVDIQASEAAV
jgi:type I restriction enzyme S subunit